MVMIRAALGVAVLLALAAVGLYFYAEIVPAPKQQIEYAVDLQQ